MFKARTLIGLSLFLAGLALCLKSADSYAPPPPPFPLPSGGYSSSSSSSKSISSPPSSSKTIMKAVRVQLNTTKTVTVNKTQSLRILSVRREKIRGQKHSSESESEEERGSFESKETASHPSCFKEEMKSIVLTEEDELFMQRFAKSPSYIPFASWDYYQAITRMLKGRWMTDDDVDNLCLTREWDLEKFDIHIYGLKRLAILECGADVTSQTDGIYCVNKRGTKISLQLEPIYTDQSSFILVIGCLGNGDKIWYTLAKDTVLSPDAKITVLEKIAALGFDVGRAVQASYANCQEHPYSSGEGSSSESREDIDKEKIGRKIAVESAATCFEKYDVSTKASVLVPSKAYVSFGSQAYYNAISHFLTGKPFEAQDSDKACVQRSRFVTTPSGEGFFKLFGFGKMALVQCTSHTDGRRGHVCVSSAFTPFTITANVVLIEGDVALIAGCLGNGEKVWFVVSKENHVQSSVKKSILQKVTDLGLEETSVELKYEQCAALPLKEKPKHVEEKPKSSEEKPEMRTRVIPDETHEERKPIIADESPKVVEERRESGESAEHPFPSGVKISERESSESAEHPLPFGGESSENDRESPESAEHPLPFDREYSEEGGEASEEEGQVGQSCFPSTSTPTEKDQKFLKTIRESEAFIPMASPEFYHVLSLEMTGKRKVTKKGLDQACVKRTWNEATGLMDITAFKKHLKAKCHFVDKTSSYRLVCQFGAELEAELVPIYTDRQHYLLVAGCCRKTHKNFWMVLSNENHVDEQAKHAIHAKVATLGFSTDATELNYHHCNGKPAEEEDGVSSEEVGKDGGKCIKPKDTLALEDIKFLNKLRQQEAHIPLGNPAYFDHLSKLLTGKEFEDNDADKACFSRVGLNRKYGEKQEGVVKGFGKKASITCTPSLDPASKGHTGYHCSDADGIFSAELSPVLTDRSNYVLIVGCFKSGEKFWFVRSSENHIDEAEKHKVLVKIGALGFPPDEVNINYHRCKGDGENHHVSSVLDEHEQNPEAESKECQIEFGSKEFTQRERKFVSEFIHELATIPMASPKMYNAISHLLTGKPLKSHDESKACFTRQFDPSLASAKIRGLGHLEVVQCKPASHNSHAGAECSSDKDPKFKIRMNAVLTDSKKFVLAVGCLANGEKVWAVASNASDPELSNREKVTVINKLIDLGFQDTTNDKIYLSYDNCGSSSPPPPPNWTSGSEEGSEEVTKLKPKSVESKSGSGSSESKIDWKGDPKVGATSDEEGGNAAEKDDKRCRNPKNPLDNSRRDEVMKLLKEGVYTPLADKSNYYGLSVSLRGKPLRDDSELTDVCPFSVWTEKSQALFAFKNSKASSDCDTSDIGSITCKPNLAKSDNKNVKVYKKRYSVVWTDGESILSINCLDKGVSTWILLSTHKTISEKTKGIVLKEVGKQGFDSTQAYEISYDECDV